MLNGLLTLTKDNTSVLNRLDLVTDANLSLKFDLFVLGAHILEDFFNLFSNSLGKFRISCLELSLNNEMKVSLKFL